jgi:iron complex transport system substrate-binding protein
MMRGRYWIAILAAVAVGHSAAADVVVTDDAGRHVHLRAPAQRIVSLAPHATELLFAVGAGEQLVGVSELSNYPEAARRIQAVNSGVRLDLERILELKPDLVVGWQSGNPRADLDRLAAFRIPIFFAEPRHLDDLPVTLEQLGRATGREAGGREAARAFREGLQRLRDDFRDRRPLWVFLQIAIQPLMTLNHSHLASDVLALCGGRNIFAGAPRVALDVSIESVLLEDPDVVLYSDALGDVAAMRAWWKERGDLDAVRAGRLYAFPAELVLRQTPRVLQGARQVCTALDDARARIASGDIK